MVVRKVDHRRYSSRGKWFKVFGYIIFLILVICVGLSGYVGWNLTHPPKLILNDSPLNYNLAFENIEFVSRTQDVTLRGWFLPANKSDTTIIMAHGYEKNRLQDDLPALVLAKSLIEADFQVVMFDFRNSGESDGTLTSVGEFEKQDLMAAIDWVKTNHPSKIGLIGFSMGGTTSLLAAADDVSIVGVVADSPFAQLLPYLQDNLSVWSDLPRFPFTPLIINLLPPITGLHPERVDALAAVDLIYPRPILFIHSVDDLSIPYQNSEKMWEKHKDAFEFWKTNKADHMESYKMEAVEYTARILAFVKRWH